jgi:hypothetical protein
MKKRDFNIAYVTAELRAKLAIAKFNKEFENAQGSNTIRKNPSGPNTNGGQTDNANRNVSGQSGY